MTRYLCILALLFSLSAVHADTEGWNTAKSTHFIVYYKAAPEDFIKQLIDQSEDYYNKIAEDLGFTRYDFWTWDKRAKVYIYDEAKDYQAATGQPAWSVGCAQVGRKVIQTFPYAQGFFETVLPHEMGHIIFREFVGLNNQAIPLWLEEGVASYQQKTKYMQADRLIKEAINQDSFIDLEKLSNMNPQLTDDPKVIALFYSEAFSIIDFLIEEFGRDRFVLFCQTLRDKQGLKPAIASAYSFSNIWELNEAWVRYLKGR